MLGQVANIGVLIIGGAILADLLIPSHLAGTQTLVNGATGLWKTSINGVLGSSS
jgi:hypothetical protein